MQKRFLLLAAYWLNSEICSIGIGCNLFSMNATIAIVATPNAVSCWSAEISIANLCWSINNMFIVIIYVHRDVPYRHLRKASFRSEKDECVLFHIALYIDAYTVIFWLNLK